MILANSLVDGFLGSNLMGQGIVAVQLLGSVVMLAVVLGKWKELSYVRMATRRFVRDFTSGHDALEYYLERRPSIATGVEGIYKETCDRLLKLLTPDVRSLLVGRQTDGNGSAALTAREIELVRGTCEHALDEEEIRLDHGMGVIASVVSLSPMLGLLGTVWMEKIQRDGLFATLERGTFADIKRMRDGGKGLNGVVLRAEGYYNPFLTLLTGGAK